MCPDVYFIDISRSDIINIHEEQLEKHVHM